ncbi:hypothetical protein BDK51DRAFT_23626, partial [Blyttiomyces helicus]
NQERALNLSILTMSGPGEFPRVHEVFGKGAACPVTWVGFVAGLHHLVMFPSLRNHTSIPSSHSTIMGQGDRSLLACSFFKIKNQELQYHLSHTSQIGSPSGGEGEGG